MTQTTTKPNIKQGVPLLREGESRGEVWRKVRGMWKNRKPDPIKELAKMRKEWDRDPLK